MIVKYCTKVRFYSRYHVTVSMNAGRRHKTPGSDERVLLLISQP